MRERVFVTFFMIFACFLFAYSFNQVGSIVDGNLNNKKKKKLILIIN
jgi:lipopolysaccharide export LptBFGC system permease protein LptF